MAEAKILSVEELSRVRKRLREEGHVVVQCHGCFDIVHPGHIRYLSFAKDQGDRLIVSVTADDHVGKGANRPYINESLRMENLAVLEFVDYVCLDRESWAGPLLDTLRPDIYVKGREYERNSDPRFLREKEVVEGYGGRVIFSSGEVVYSSSDIISQFRERFALDQQRLRFFCRRHEITEASLLRLVDEFAGLRMLVVGEPILDRYIHCDVDGVAGEGPILDAHPLNEDLFLGAGALVAKQCTVLGARATFLTALGTDDPRTGRFVAALEEAGVGVVAEQEDGRPVLVKSRYLVDGSKVFKLNEGQRAPMSTLATRSFLKHLEELTDEHDALVVVDFGFGLFGDRVTDGICEISQRFGKPYFVDVSRSSAGSILRFKQPALAAPTEEELRLAFSDRESGLSNLASRYYRRTQAQKLVITLGKRGAVVFDPPVDNRARLSSDYMISFSSHAVDAVGAGDVFLTTAALAQLGGGSTAEALYLASAVAALHVSRLGNEPVGILDLQRFLADREELGR